MLHPPEVDAFTIKQLVWRASGGAVGLGTLHIAVHRVLNLKEHEFQSTRIFCAKRSPEEWDTYTLRHA